MVIVIVLLLVVVAVASAVVVVQNWILSVSVFASEKRDAYLNV
jgi:NADH:ubiquinone oxidoreductase subunit 3 (subunit A)